MENIQSCTEHILSPQKYRRDILDKEITSFITQDWGRETKKGLIEPRKENK